jgi:hypothetical protein
MNKLTETIGLFFIGLVVIAIFAIIMAIPTWFLWNNCLASAINGVNEISLLQALGINFLFSILFKGNNSTNSSKN